MDTLADSRHEPVNQGHGPECPFGNGQHPWYWNPSNKRWMRRNGQNLTSCECVTCHCGDDHQPGGFLGACRRCHRPLVVNGKVVR